MFTKYLLNVFPFISRLYIDREDELKFNSPYFNIRRWAQVIVLVSSLLMTLMMAERLLVLSRRYVDLHDSYEELKAHIRYIEDHCGIKDFKK